MKIRHLVALVAGLVLAQGAFAGDGAALVQKANCLGCHAPDQKKVGPSFKDIAEKYKGNKGAAAELEKKVRSGGSGNWGKMAMPPTPASVSDGDIKDIVQWVLSTK